MVLVRLCLSRTGSVLGGANGFGPLLGGGENCVLSAENTFLSAEDAEGRGEHLFVRGETRRTEKALGVLFA